MFLFSPNLLLLAVSTFSYELNAFMFSRRYLIFHTRFKIFTNDSFFFSSPPSTPLNFFIGFLEWSNFIFWFSFSSSVSFSNIFILFDFSFFPWSSLAPLLSSPDISLLFNYSSFFSTPFKFVTSFDGCFLLLLREMFPLNYFLKPILYSRVINPMQVHDR